MTTQHPFSEISIAGARKYVEKTCLISVTDYTAKQRGLVTKDSIAYILSSLTQADFVAAAEKGFMGWTFARYSSDNSPVSQIPMLARRTVQQVVLNMLQLEDSSQVRVGVEFC